MTSRFTALSFIALFGCSTTDGDASIGGSSGTTGTRGTGNTADSGGATTQGNSGDETDDVTSMSPDGTNGGGETGEPPALETFSSGDRLRAIVVGSDEQTEVFVGWRDTELELDCALEPSGGGEFRCFPTAFGSLMFADAACEEQAIPAPCGDKPAYVRAIEGEICPDPSTWTVSAWSVGDAVDSVWRVDGEGNCTEFVGVSGYRVAKAANELFARALSETVQVSAELSRRELTSDDGATQWLGPYDTGRDAQCQAISVDNATVCVSGARASLSTSIHDERTCAGVGLLQYANKPDCEPPEISIFPDGTLVGVGELVPSDMLYGGNTAESCGPFVAPDSSVFSRVARSAPTFPAAEVASLGDGRLRPRMVTDLEGNPVAPAFPIFHDADLGFDCRPGDTESGGLACLPLGWAYPGFYSDAGCEELLLRVVGDFDAVPGYYAVTEQPMECERPAAVEIRQLGERFEGQTYWLSGGECTPIDPALIGLGVFTLESPQPVDVLVSLTESVQ